jgi:hypothetical protein
MCFWGFFAHSLWHCCLQVMLVTPVMSCSTVCLKRLQLPPFDVHPLRCSTLPLSVIAAARYAGHPSEELLGSFSDNVAAAAA